MRDQPTPDQSAGPREPEVDAAGPRTGTQSPEELLQELEERLAALVEEQERRSVDGDDPPATAVGVSDEDDELPKQSVSFAWRLLAILVTLTLLATTILTAPRYF